jgi:hypothetical protein
MEISELTKNNFKNIGSNPENIKRFKEYMSDDSCENLIKLIKNTENTNNNVLHTDSLGLPSLSLVYYDSVKISEEYIESIHSLIQKEYSTKIKFRHSRLTEWRHSHSQSIMIDDLGSKDSNHMSACMYLNKDYAGAELDFVNQNVSFRPDSGELLLFPGNIHYSYKIQPGIGSVYFIQTWFDFI